MRGQGRTKRTAGLAAIGVCAVLAAAGAVLGQPAHEEPEVPPAIADTALTPATNRVVSVTRLTDPALAARRPRFSPDGQSVVFTGGAEGDGDIYAMGLRDSAAQRLTEGEGDDRDPAFTADGRIVWSSNREGSYDLWIMNADGTEPNRLTDFEGDELEPAPNAVPFQFSAVGPGSCGEAYSAREIDAYHKIAYSRSSGETTEIWMEPLGASFTAAHRHRLSPEGQSCSQPAWSGNGLALVFTCGGDAAAAVQAADATWTADLAGAVAMLEYNWDDPASYCAETELDPMALEMADSCLDRFPRQYATYPAAALSAAGDALGMPTFSANQTLYLASPIGGATAVSVRPRSEGAWQAVDVAPAQPLGAVWSPDGTRLAFSASHEGGSAIYLAETDFYLQEVRDLVDYPELYGARASDRMHQNRFLARPGDQRELFAAYDRIEYAHRGAFVTVDAVLQAFHDEFARLLKDGEREAQDALAAMSWALAEHYAVDFHSSGDGRARYLAVYFGVPAVLLDAAAAIQPTDALPGEDLWLVAECRRIREIGAAGGALSEDENLTLQDCPEPGPSAAPVEQIAANVEAPLSRIRDELRADVRAQIEAVLAHEGIRDLEVPGEDRPVMIDFSLFQVRGHYAGSALAGYFLAMAWYGLIPIPLDESAFALLERLETSPSTAPGLSLWQEWERVDNLVGAFMGRPVDVSLRHLAALRHDNPDLLHPYQADVVRARLQELRGPIPFRGVAGALGDGEYPLQLTLFPRRVGHDVTFFTALTHPDTPERGMPTALDVAAGLGSERARHHVQAVEAAEPWADAYLAALERTAAETAALGEGFWSTDIYHGWLAMLRTLATPLDYSDEARLRFAESPSWQDRELLALLAGYTQLKHDAVLYAFQESGVQCGDEPVYLAFVERPVLPPPRGFVEPRPDFFHAAANLAGRIYGELAGGEPPLAETWATWDSEGVNVQLLAQRLAELAEQELRGEPLDPSDEEWLRQIGPVLEALLLGGRPNNEQDAAYGEDEGRMTRGVALVTDLYTNIQRAQVLQVGIGRLLDLYVAVPDGVGERMTQGAILSWYEFAHPMSDRLTDEAWNSMLEAGAAPPTAPWMESFVEVE